MASSIIDHLAQTHSAFIHGKGYQGTLFLISKMGLKGHEIVLEIGCGTGATLVEMNNRYPTISLAGMDISERMLKSCRQRLAFCGAKGVGLINAKNKNDFKSDFFDVVYIESVLGILENGSLEQTLAFIHRVLKPNGKLIFNESIWLESVSLRDIDQYNKKAKQLFGIIQCRREFRGTEGVTQYLKQKRFENLEVYKIPIENSTFYSLKSKVYSFWGYIKKRLFYSLSKKEREFQEMMRLFYEGNDGSLHPYIFVSRPLQKRVLETTN